MFNGMNVAVRFIAHDLMSPSMMKMTANMRLFDRNASLVEMRLKRMRSLAFTGAGMLFAGGATAYGLAKLISPATQYLNLLAQANAMGMKHVEIEKMKQKAWETTSKVQTVSLNEAMKMFLDLRYAMKGGTADAAKHLLEVARIKTAITVASSSGAFGGRQINAEEMAYSAVKAAEMMGKTKNAAMFNNAIQHMIRVMIATGGRVTPADFQQNAKYARQAIYGLSDKFLYGPYVTMMLQMKKAGGGMGAARGGPGAMIAAFYRFSAQGMVSKDVLQNWASIGMIKDVPKLNASQTTEVNYLSKVFARQAAANKPLMVPKGHENAYRDLRNLSPFVGSAIAAENPHAWVLQYVLPHIRKYYPKATDKEMLRILNSLFKGSQLAASMSASYFSQKTVYAKDIELIKKVPSVANIIAVASRSPAVIAAAVQAQWSTVRTSLGIGFVTLLLPYLQKLAGWLDRVGLFFKAHPRVAENLIKIVGALSLALGVGGLVTLLVALANPIGLVVIGITALVSAFIAFHKEIFAFEKAFLHLITNVLFGAPGSLRRKLERDVLIGAPGSTHRAAIKSIATRVESIGKQAVGDVFLDSHIVGKIVLQDIADLLPFGSLVYSGSSDIATNIPTPAQYSGAQ